MALKVPPSPVAMLAAGLGQVCLEMEEIGFKIEELKQVPVEVRAFIHDLQALRAAYVDALAAVGAEDVAEAEDEAYERWRDDLSAKLAGKEVAG